MVSSSSASLSCNLSLVPSSVRDGIRSVRRLSSICSAAHWAAGILSFAFLSADPCGGHRYIWLASASRGGHLCSSSGSCEASSWTTLGAI